MAKTMILTENGSHFQTSFRKRYLYSILLLSVIGSFLAFYSTQLTYQLAGNFLAEPSGCYVNAWINCDSVLSTRFAKMYGIPVALFGFLYYLLTIFLILHALFTSNHKQAIASVTVVLLFTCVAVLFSLFKAYQLIQLKVLCPVCIGMYIVNLSLLFLLLMSLNLSLRKFGAFLGSYFKSFSSPASAHAFSFPLTLYAIFITWVFIIGFLGDYYLDKPSSKKHDVFDIEKAIAEHFAQTPVDLTIDAHAAYKGNPEAGVSIVAFSDFLCPACRMLATQLPNVLLEYQKDVAFYFMNYPLDQSINENVKSNIHPNAGLAAMAGVCAQQQGDFWGYHDAIFQTEKEIDLSYLLSLAEENGWEREAFEKCMDVPETRERVINDIQAGEAAKITGTPSIFINGRPIKYWNNPAFIKVVIEEELERNKSQNPT